MLQKFKITSYYKRLSLLKGDSMLQKFIITSYTIIFTLAVVFILPVAGEAADTPPASPVEKNNTGSWKTGSSSDLINSSVSGRTVPTGIHNPAGDPKDKMTSEKVEPNNPEDFPMSEWKPPVAEHLGNQKDAVIAEHPENPSAESFVDTGKIQEHPTHGKVWVPLGLAKDDDKPCGCNCSGCPDPKWVCIEPYCLIVEDDDHPMMEKLKAIEDPRMTPNLGSLKSGGKEFRRPIPIPPALEPK
jgi:hypothetical protein